MGIKESIGWAARTWNPVTGCWGPGGSREKPNRCSYCYAHRMAKRLRGRFGYPVADPFKPTFHPERLEWPSRWKKGANVFVCSMGDLFGAWISDELITTILQITSKYRQHNYFFLTKYPQRYCSIGSTNGNIMFGTTVENQDRARERIPHLLAGPLHHTFVSIEPLLGPVDLEKIITYRNGIYTSWLDALNGKTYHNGPGGVITTDKPKLKWVIVGAQTGPGATHNAPKREWIESIVVQVKTSGIPLFMKNNLEPYWKGDLIQEWPQL